ncbi:MAG: hypothetical protein ACI88C_001602, partial [Acidimicrobiales bacterium]
GSDPVMSRAVDKDKMRRSGQGQLTASGTPNR